MLIIINVTPIFGARSVLSADTQKVWCVGNALESFQGFPWETNWVTQSNGPVTGWKLSRFVFDRDLLEAIIF